MSPSKLHPDRLAQVQMIVRWLVLLLSFIAAVLGYYFVPVENAGLVVLITIVVVLGVKHGGLPFLVFGINIGKSLYHAFYAIGSAVVAGSTENGVLFFLAVAVALIASKKINDAIKKQYAD